MIEGSLEVKLPTIWTDEKQSRAEAKRRERLEERRSEKRKSQKKEDADARKGRKVAKHCFFRCFVAPEGRKVGSLKRRVRRHLGRWEMKSCTPLWREEDFEVKRYKTPGSRSAFGSWDVEKVHAVVERSAFRSEKVQNTWVSEHFWKLRCRKSARRCGAKHISKSKCAKHIKAPHVRSTFGSWDVEKVHAVVARSTFRSQNAQSTPLSDHFWRFRCRKLARRCGAKHISKSEC